RDYGERTHRQIYASVSHSNELAQIELPPHTNFAEVLHRFAYYLTRYMGSMAHQDNFRPACDRRVDPVALHLEDAQLDPRRGVGYPFIFSDLSRVLKGRSS